MPRKKGLEPGSPLPTFTLPDTTGQLIPSTSWKGKATLIVFHRGTWCYSCRKELHQLSENKPIIDDLGVNVVVVLGQKKESVIHWLENNPLPFPVLVDEDRSVIKKFDVYHLIGIDALNIAHPSVFLVSPEQKIVFGYVGRTQMDFPKPNQLANIIHELLSKTEEV